MCLHTNKLLVISVVIILKVMGIFCSNLSLLLLSKWDDSCVHVCCECELNSKHTVQHYLIFKGKAEARCSPSFPFSVRRNQKKKKDKKVGVGLIRQLSFVTALFIFIKTLILTANSFGNV